MKNKDIHYKILKYLEDNKFKTHDVQFLNHYFIIDKGEDSICHFKVKGLKKWKFGIWINELDDGKKQVEFFGQYEPAIDKFKPSRSNIHCEDMLIGNFVDFEILNQLNFIKNFKYTARYNDMYYRRFRYGELGSAFVLLKDSVDTLYNKFKDNLKSIYNLYRCKLSLIKFKYFNKYIDEYKITDCNKNQHGFIVSPRYDIDILFHEHVTDEQIDIVKKYYRDNDFYNMKNPYYYDWEDVVENDVIENEK